MNEPTTTSGQSLYRTSEQGPQLLVTALLLTWCPAQPSRVGEVVLVPPGEPGPLRLLGRGMPQPHDPWPRLVLMRQRPGMLEPTGPVGSPGISREQLCIRSGPEGRLQVENIGRCPLLHNGVLASKCEVSVGDLLELRGQIQMLCVRRPDCLPALPSMGGLALQPFGEPDVHQFVGESPEMWRLREQIAFIGPRSEHVLIHGASGTGKELVARAIHDCSSRRHRPLVSRNAATLPEGLIDGELFGNVRNYPNSGLPARPGLIGEAHGSSLFLDEFAELSPPLQAHLLRLLDRGEYQRLGEAQLRRSDFRLLAATNRPLEALKHDLLARLTFRVFLPDLNQRREDIPLLVLALLRRMAERNPDLARRFFVEYQGRLEPRVSAELMGFLVQHPYATHVREIETLLWQAVQESTGEHLELPRGLRGVCTGVNGPASPPDSGPREPRDRSLESLSTGSRVTSAGASDVAGMETASLDVEGFTERERALITLHRRHRFRVSECCREVSYPVDRSTADIHLRVLLMKALSLSQWNLEAAAGLLSGEGDLPLKQTVTERLEVMIENLAIRMKEEDRKQLQTRLMRQFRAYYPHVEALLAALEEGRLVSGVSREGRR